MYEYQGKSLREGYKAKNYLRGPEVVRILREMKNNKINKTLIVGFSLFLLFGCNQENISVEPDVQTVLQEEGGDAEYEAPLEKRIRFSSSQKSFEAFVSEISFKDGESAPAEEIISVERGNGIEVINLRKIYEESEGDSALLNKVIIDLKSAYQVAPAEQTTVEIFHDSLHMPGSGVESGLLAYLESLEVEGLSEEEFYQAHYALNLAAKYEEAQELRDMYCPKIDCRTVRVVIGGQITNKEGMRIDEAIVRLLNEEAVNAVTKSNGQYRLEYDVVYPNKLRFSASKPGFSTSFQDEYLLFDVEPEEGYELRADFSLMESAGSVRLTEGSIVRSRGVRVTRNDDNSLKIDLNDGDAIFELKDGFVDKNGEPLDEEVVVDVFYFPVSEEDLIRENYLNVDVMGDNISIIGNQFVTFGMPLIDIKTVDGEPVYIHKNNPAKVEFGWRDGFIDGERRDAKDFFSDENWDKMIEFSLNSEEEFPLNDVSLEELFDGLSTLDGMYPIWWQLNYRTGLWEPAGFKILDEEGRKAQGMVYQID